jgi:hypothetical protein
MSTKDERKSLISDPLPMDLSELSRIIPVNYSMVGPDKVLTSIVEIDEQVSRVQEILAPFVQYMQEQRETLMKRALEESITKDAHAMLIETKGRQERNAIEDLEAFELQFPGALEKIREEQERKIRMKFDKDIRGLPDASLPLTVADQVVGKDAVTEFVGLQPVKITYEVRRK